ncbi:MAG: NADH-quinone oxidoreductase subunit A [Deltaproteobacteria bacterium]|nr:NADH-quinone oxidoreductase subunit A [Deltaproteobacteria bacterium]
MNPYLPIIIILGLGVALGLILSGFAHFLGPRHPTPAKEEIFECGVPTVASRERMSVKFYLTAILFILFDIETVFLFLWAKAFRSLAWFGIVEVAVFVLILVAGYLYVLKTGALEWD